MIVAASSSPVAPTGICVGLGIMRSCGPSAPRAKMRSPLRSVRGGVQRGCAQVVGAPEGRSLSLTIVGHLTDGMADGRDLALMTVAVVEVDGRDLARLHRV